MRAHLVAAACLLAGGPGLAISLGRLSRALRFRFQRGRPYIPGSIRRTAFSSLVFGILAAAGAGLAGTLWLTRDLQPVHGVTRAGEMRVTEQGGELLLELRVGEGTGEAPILATGLAGATWMVTGTVITFPTWMEPAGVEAWHGLVQAGGPEMDPRPPPPHLSRAVTVFRRLPAWMGISVERRSLGGRGPLPDWTGVMATRDGYFLGLGGPAPGESGSP